MPRAIWSGSVSFGLVNIPVKLYNAVSRKSVHFNQLDAKTGARVKRKWISAADGRDLENDEIIRGYELPSGEYVTVEDDELAALDPDAVRTIDIDEFVDLDDIDPIFYDSAYYLAPDKATTKPYALLAEAMERANKVGVARFVMRGKQYLAAVRPKDGRLLLSTMVYADEVNDPADIGELDDVGDVDLPDREVEMAMQLIDSLGVDEFEAEKYEDTYRTQVLDLIERKAAGETEVIAAPAEPEPSKVIDLMAALEASVKEAKVARGRHPTSNTDEGEVTTKPAKRAGKKTAKKASAAKKSTKKSTKKTTARKSA